MMIAPLLLLGLATAAPVDTPASDAAASTAIVPSLPKEAPAVPSAEGKEMPNPPPPIRVPPVPTYVHAAPNGGDHSTQPPATHSAAEQGHH